MLPSPTRSLAGRRHHHNHRHSTPSRRANAVATIAAPLHAVRSRGRIAASCHASVHTVGARRPRLARRRYVVGCRRATWGGQRPVGPCTLVPSGTRPSRQEPAGGAVLVLRVAIHPLAHVLVHKCDSVVHVNISWGWLGGQGPVGRALVGAGTFAHAPCQGSIDEPIFGVPRYRRCVRGVSRPGPCAPTLYSTG